MEHFTIFQDFYRVIAEMTEEEIVSAISNGTYRETVEDAESSRNKARKQQTKRK